MPVPVLGEVAQGAVNGVNRTYSTAHFYKDGSLRVFLNGLLGLRELVDGWTELGGNRFRLNFAPKVEDQVQVYYLAI